MPAAPFPRTIPRLPEINVSARRIFLSVPVVGPDQAEAEAVFATIVRHARTRRSLSSDGLGNLTADLLHLDARPLHGMAVHFRLRVSAVDDAARPSIERADGILFVSGLSGRPAEEQLGRVSVWNLSGAPIHVVWTAPAQSAPPALPPYASLDPVARDDPAALDAMWTRLVRRLHERLAASLPAAPALGDGVTPLAPPTRVPGTWDSLRLDYDTSGLRVTLCDRHLEDVAILPLPPALIAEIRSTGSRWERRHGYESGASDGVPWEDADFDSFERDVRGLCDRIRTALRGQVAVHHAIRR